MKLLIDMNLSPRWVAVFEKEGWEAMHWTAVGNPDAPDELIMEWAREHDCIVFTHDLDFGTLLALTQTESPSVIQVRTQDVTPGHLAKVVVDAINQFVDLLHAGTLIVIDEGRSRARVLPLRR